MPGRDAPAEGIAEPRRSRAALLALLAVLLGTTLIRLRLLGVPLERDEGEFAYVGQLILRGEIPYVAAHNMKLPGVYYGYAAILALFGESTAGVHLGLLLINLACIVLVWALGRRLSDPITGAVAAAAFAALSLSPSVLGLAAKGEHFVVLFALVGAVLLAGERSLGRLAAAGFAFGVAFVMKQHAAVFSAFGLVLLLLEGYRRREGIARVLLEAAAFSAAAALPIVATCLAMARLGAFEPFWFWTFTYAREYVAQIPFAVGMGELRRQARDIGAASAMLWALAAVGLLAPLWDRRLRPRAAFVLLFAAFSFLAVCPGLRFSEHYFVLLLPAASLLVGSGVSSLARLAGERQPRLASLVTVGLPALAIASALFTQRANLFVRSPAELSRAVYGLNPFPEAVEMARYLREHARPGDTVAVVGSEPEVYFYSGLRAATSYIYMYPLMEPQPFARQMQADMIAQIEKERPRFLVFVNVDKSWSRRPDSSTALLEWAERTAAADYTAVGLAEMEAGRATAYRWGEAARDAAPGSRLFVVLLERRT